MLHPRAVAGPAAYPLLGLLFSFAVGATVSVEIHLVGVLRLSELLLAGFCLLALANGSLSNALRISVVPFLLLLGAGWLLSQFASDQLNDTSRVNMLKGHANIGMIFTSLLGFLTLFLSDVRRYVSFLIGSVVGHAVEFLLTGITNTAETWDVHIAPWSGPATLLVAIHLITAQRARRFAVAVTCAYGIASIVFGARSHGLVFILTGTTLLAASGVTSTGMIASFVNNRRRVGKAALALVVTAPLVFVAYIELARSGYLTAKAARQIQAIKNPYNPLAVLSAGRGGPAIAAMAISEKPLFGHGSKAHNPKYTLMSSDRRAGDPRPEIPVHSTLFSGWVFSGLLGGIFWMYVLLLHLRFLRNSLTYGSHFAILICSYLAWSGAWGILFSPFGYARFDWPPVFAAAVLTLVFESGPGLPVGTPIRPLESQRSTNTASHLRQTKPRRSD